MSAISSTTNSSSYAPSGGIRLEAAFRIDAKFLESHKNDFHTGTVGKPNDDGTIVKSVPFSEMFAGAVASEVDTNSDSSISFDEYKEQIYSAGGTQDTASSLYKALDTNGDGSVSLDELAASIAAPSASIKDDLIAQIKQEDPKGQDHGLPKGMVLDANGQAKDPKQAMRFIMWHFPSNLDLA